ncbi:MAG: hypothetical protein ACOX1I_09365 [Dethiobacteria bacterium]
MRCWKKVAGECLFDREPGTVEAWPGASGEWNSEAVFHEKEPFLGNRVEPREPCSRP